MAVDVDDGGANHSAGGDQHGVQQDVLRGVHHGAQCGAQCWVERGSRDAAGGGREVPKQRLNPNRDTDDTISVSLIPLLPSELHRVTSGHRRSQEVTGGHSRSQQVTADTNSTLPAAVTCSKLFVVEGVMKHLGTNDFTKLL